MIRNEILEKEMKSKLEKEYPLTYELVKTEIASTSYDLNRVDAVMYNTPVFVLKAIEHHLQGEQ